MSNAAKIILIAAGILITLGIVAYGVQIFNVGSEPIKQSTTRMTKFSNNLSNMSWEGFEDTIVQGSAVSNSIKLYQSEPQFGVRVITGKNTTGVWYGNELSLAPATYGNTIGAGTGATADANNPASINYINPSGSFRSTVVRDNNDVVRGILFVQQ